MHKSHVFPSGFLVRGLYALISMFLDKYTVSKITFFANHTNKGCLDGYDKKYL